MKILALDTSTEYCSLALWLDGNMLCKEVLAGQKHTELLLPMLQEMLAKSGLALTQLVQTMSWQRWMRVWVKFIMLLILKQLMAGQLYKHLFSVCPNIYLNYRASAAGLGVVVVLISIMNC